jgi:hypothetical protein
MKRTIIPVLALLMLALPASARAGSATITASCNGVENGCSSAWYTTSVTVKFSVAGSGIKSVNCPDLTVSSDTAGVDASCVVTFTDNTITGKAVTIKRDATPPTATGIALQRGPDANGWYNHAVGVTASGTDATSGVASCTSVTYAGPDAAAATVSGTCTDQAGNVSSPKALSFQYDATAPSVSPAPARAADANGWYNHAVDVSFQGTDPVSGVDACTAGSYSGPDSATASVSGNCRDKAGNSASSTFALHYDSTPPVVAAPSPSRPPDAGGWYNHALTVAYQGTDAVSGIDTCDAVSYGKPDDASATVSGSCRDKAGNAGAPTTFTFKFDSTPPKLAKLAAAPTDAAVDLTWTASTDVAALTVTRTRAGKGAPVTLYSGKRITSFTDRKVQNGSRYAYLVTALDAAGNRAVGKAAGDAGASLLSPRKSAQVRGGTTLRWRAAPHATYYNVQLWLRGAKVLTTWPGGTSLRLPRLRPGAYVWLVWPGLGPRTAHRYGKLIGRSTFVVRG